MGDWIINLTIYTRTKIVIDAFIDVLFGIIDNFASDITTAVTATAAVYIALMGYAVISGAVSMTQREAAMRLGKVVFIIFLLQTFGSMTGSAFENTWEVAESVGNYLADEIFPAFSAVSGITIPGMSAATDFDSLVDFNTGVSAWLAQEVGGSNSGMYPVLVWAFAMAPAVLTVVTLFLAKVVLAVLFICAPIVFILSLLGVQYNFLTAWFKALISTYVTAIIVYVIGTFGIMITMIQMGTTLLLTLGGGGTSVPEMTPLGITAIFSTILITQAPNIAASFIGVATVSAQQATSFMQTAVLQGAIRGSGIGGASGGAKP